MPTALGTFLNIPVIEDEHFFRYGLVTEHGDVFRTAYQVPAKCDLFFFASTRKDSIVSDLYET